MAPAPSARSCVILIADPSPVDASASPLEGMAERANWLALSAAEDPFGSALLKAGANPRAWDYCHYRSSQH